MTPDGGTILADGSGLRNLTNNPAYDVSPAWSPDGSKIAFISDRRYAGQIYVMNVDGSSVTSLGVGLASADHLVTLTASGIAFTRHTFRSSNVWIHVMNSDGSSVRQLTNTGKDFRPARSPDGTRIIFSSSRDGNNEIYTMNADGSDQVNLTNNPAPRGHGETEQSPEPVRPGRVSPPCLWVPE